MRVFVTGATGFIGSAIVRELLAAGHQVLGLARSDAAADTLARLGVAVHRGDVTDAPSLAAGAQACDGVIHTAFIHDFSQFKANCETDRHAIEAMGAALVGSDRPLVITSGTGLLASSALATEDQVSTSTAIPRVASEEAAASVAALGVRVSVVRLPPSVHGEGDHGFVPRLVELARAKRVSAYVGDGGNRWPAVHRLDAAQLFRLAFEKGAAWARYHGVAEEGVPMRAIAETIGEGLGMPVHSIAPDQAAAQFDWLAHFVQIDNPASSTLTREALGWHPRQVGLLQDMRNGGYFA